MQHTAYLLLGSNIEPRIEYISKALALLSQELIITKRSSMYETAAWGMKEGTHSFLNMVIEVETGSSAQELLSLCIKCETGLGRIRTTELIPRTIDIDILLFDDEIIHSENLIVPHPRLHLRRFTLVPLAEIAPYLIHPVLKKNIKELLNECVDKSEVKPHLTSP